MSTSSFVLASGLFLGSFSALAHGATPATTTAGGPLVVASKPVSQHPADKNKPAPKPATKPAEKSKPAPAKAEPTKAAAPKAFAIGQPVDPALAFTDLRGTSHKLADMKGKTLVLAFWSTSCAAYDARLQQLAKDFAGKDVVVALVDADHADVDAKAEKPYAKIEEHLQKHALDLQVYVDRDGALAHRFDVKETPSAFVIDAQGTLRYAGPVGDDPDPKADKNAPSVRKALTTLGSAKPAPTPAGKPAEKPDGKKG